MTESATRRLLKEVLCNKPTEGDSAIDIRDNTLRVGKEHGCTVSGNGKGSCGEDFYEGDGEYCRWCCQILSFYGAEK